MKHYAQALSNWIIRVGTVICLLAAVAAYLLALAATRVWFGVRDWTARNVYDLHAPLRRVRGPFVLLLRSFANGMAYVDLQWTRTSDGTGIDSQRALASDVFGKLLASCEHETFFGIADGRRLESLHLLNMPDRYWFTAFNVLAKHAKAILILPEDSANLLREVASVVANHPAKVTVLMPPSCPAVREHTTDGTFVYTRQEVERKPQWEKARVAFESVGVRLPAYDSMGAFLRVGIDGELEVIGTPWGGSGLAEILQTSNLHGDAQAALRELRLAGVPLVSIPRREALDPRRKIHKRAAPNSVEGAVDDCSQLAPLQRERRRQQAALSQLSAMLTGDDSLSEPRSPGSSLRDQDPS